MFNEWFEFFVLGIWILVSLIIYAGYKVFREGKIDTIDEVIIIFWPLYLMGFIICIVIEIFIIIFTFLFKTFSKIYYILKKLL